MRQLVVRCTKFVPGFLLETYFSEDIYFCVPQTLVWKETGKLKEGNIVISATHRVASHTMSHTHHSQHLLMCSWRPLTSDKGKGSEWLLSPCLGWHFRLSPHPVVAMLLKDCLPGAPKKVGRVLEITFFTTFPQLLCPFPLTYRVWTPDSCPGLWTNTQHRKARFASSISHLLTPSTQASMGQVTVLYRENDW